MLIAGAEYWTKLTAIGTLALALVSLVLLVPTAIGVWLANKAAKEDLTATREAAKEAREATHRQIEVSYRPLLIDVAVDAPVPEDMPASRSSRIVGDRPEPTGPKYSIVKFPADPQPMTIDPRRMLVAMAEGRLKITLPLRNVGWGLAVIEPGAVSVRGPRVGATTEIEVSRERVPPNETTRITCECELGNWDDAAPSYVLHVPYTDFAGGQATVALINLQPPSTEPGHWRVSRVEQLEVMREVPLAK